jgi:hypothetical protein
MSEKKNPSVAQVLARLRRVYPNPLTAARLNTTTNRLRGQAFVSAGVVEVGHEKTGRAGRPAVLFSLTEEVAIRDGLLSATPPTEHVADSDAS